MDKHKPQLIKAGDTRLKLGHLSQPPLVDCRVVAEDYYQTMLGVIKQKDLIIRELEARIKRRDILIEKIENNLGLK